MAHFVAMDDVWSVTPARAAGVHDVTLHAGPPRPLVARLTDAELAQGEGALSAVAEAVRRGEFSRVQLGRTFREAIGRDPFRQQHVADAQKERMRSVWIDIAFLAIFVIALTGDQALWVRVMAGGFAALTVADLVRHGWQRWKADR
jgi:hypothetical protein